MSAELAEVLWSATAAAASRDEARVEMELALIPDSELRNALKLAIGAIGDQVRNACAAVGRNPETMMAEFLPQLRPPDADL